MMRARGRARIEHGIGDLDVAVGRRADEHDIGRIAHRIAGELQRDRLVPLAVAAGIDALLGAVERGGIVIGQGHLPVAAPRGIGKMIADRAGPDDFYPVHRLFWIGCGLP